MGKWRDFIKERTNALLKDDSEFDFSQGYIEDPAANSESVASDKSAAGKVETIVTTGQTARTPAGNAQIMVLDHITRRDATQIADQVGSNRMVVLNLGETPEEDRRRILDFISGYLYGGQGTVARINTNAYIAAPGYVDLFGEVEEDKTLFSQLVEAFGGRDEMTDQPPEAETQEAPKAETKPAEPPKAEEPEKPVSAPAPIVVEPAAEAAEETPFVVVDADEAAPVAAVE